MPWQLQDMDTLLLAAGVSGRAGVRVSRWSQCVCVSMAGSPCALLSSQLPVAVCEEGGREEAAWESGSLSLSLSACGWEAWGGCGGRRR